MAKHSGSAPRRRVVLLGASNLARSFPVALAEARAVLGGPLDVLGALGYGRSYGMSSRVLARTLPSIRDCGLWRALSAREPGPTWAVVTDPGNDIGYGAPAATAAEWVGEAIERLVAAGARTVVTLLPIESLGALGPRRYAILRSLLFPSCRLSLQEVLARAGDLDSAVRERARSLGAVTVEPDPGWYGFDAIHIRRRLHRAAWARIAGEWLPASDGRDGCRTVSGTAPGPCPGGTKFGALARWSRAARESTTLRLLRPEESWFCGAALRCRQPTGLLADGTTVALY